MATSVIMPALELAQETGKVIRWLKAPGDAVAKGEPLLEIETDKVTTEIEAPASGILMNVSAREGDVIPVGQAIAQIGAPGEAGAAAPAGSPPRAAVAVARGGDQGLAPRPEDRRAARRRPGAGEDEHRQDREGRRPGICRGADGGGARSCGPRATRRASQRDGQRAAVRLGAASPKARRLAAERGLDIRTMRGSGPQGAVLAADILSAPVTPVVPAPAARPSDGQGVGAVWRIMAERMTASWTTAPHFYLFREVTVGRLAAWRQQAEKQTGGRITYTDLLVKLVAAALARHPAVNASWRDGAIARHAEINIGLAVAVEDGLIVPVIHRADTLGLAAIAARREDVVSRAQGGKLRPADIQGGTFTISNLGMFGVDAFNAIVNPPQAAILAVGRIADRVVARRRSARRPADHDADAVVRPPRPRRRARRTLSRRPRRPDRGAPRPARLTAADPRPPFATAAALPEADHICPSDTRTGCARRGTTSTTRGSRPGRRTSNGPPSPRSRPPRRRARRSTCRSAPTRGVTISWRSSRPCRIAQRPHPDLVDRAKGLDKHYLPSRYPTGFAQGTPRDHYTLREAEQAIADAAAVIEFCARSIPR